MRVASVFLEIDMESKSSRLSARILRVCSPFDRVWFHKLMPEIMHRLEIDFWKRPGSPEDVCSSSQIFGAEEQGSVG
jgi:hypothetical protein